MPEKTKTVLVAGVFLLAFCLLFSSLYADIEGAVGGNLIGHIFSQDGSTPIEGASLAIRNVSTGKVYVSSQSEQSGIVRIEGIETGFYKLGIVTPEGNFYAKNLIGVNIKENETEEISIAINPYSAQEAKAISDLLKEQDENEEAIIGYVLRYDVPTGMAEIELTKGMLKVDALVYIRGEKNSFRQKIENILMEGEPVNEAYEGDTCLINCKLVPGIGDLVYLCQKRRILPFWLDLGTPVGLAIVLGTTTGVTYTIIKTIKKKPEASPFKTKK